MLDVYTVILYWRGSDGEYFDLILQLLLWLPVVCDSTKKEEQVEIRGYMIPQFFFILLFLHCTLELKSLYIPPVCLQSRWKVRNTTRCVSYQAFNTKLTPAIFVRIHGTSAQLFFVRNQPVFGVEIRFWRSIEKPECISFLLDLSTQIDLRIAPCYWIPVTRCNTAENPPFPANCIIPFPANCIILSTAHNFHKWLLQ